MYMYMYISILFHTQGLEAKFHVHYNHVEARHLLTDDQHVPVPVHEHRRKPPAPGILKFNCQAEFYPICGALDALN